MFSVSKKKKKKSMSDVIQMKRSTAMQNSRSERVVEIAASRGRDRSNVGASFLLS